MTPFVVLNGDVTYDIKSLATLYDSGPSVGSSRRENPSNTEFSNSTRTMGCVSPTSC